MWCFNLRRLPYTSAKWGWLFRNTPSVSSHHSSRKECLTTAATGRGRAASGRGTPMQCLVMEAGSQCRAPARLLWLQAGTQQPARAAHELTPSAWLWRWDALLADGDPDGQLFLFHCSWTWPFPHWASFSLCHWGPSLVAGWMCLDYPGLSAPSQAGTSQSGWLTRPPINDFHLVSPFTKIYSYFYIPSIWLAVSHKKPFKLFCCIFSLFTSFESELLYNI